jgi:hypothetical protein
MVLRTMMMMWRLFFFFLVAVVEMNVMIVLVHVFGVVVVVVYRAVVVAEMVLLLLLLLLAHVVVVAVAAKILRVLKNYTILVQHDGVPQVPLLLLLPPVPRTSPRRRRPHPYHLPGRSCCYECFVVVYQQHY